MKSKTNRTLLSYFSTLITSDASIIFPTWILSWLSFTILNLPLPTCWIWARNTLLEPWTIHQLRTSSSSSLDCRCCFMPNKILSAVTPAIYCLLYYNNIYFKVLSNWCEKDCFLSRSRRHDITNRIAVPSASIPLYISEIELRVSTFNIPSDFSRNSRTAIFFLLTK